MCTTSISNRNQENPFEFDFTFAESVFVWCRNIGGTENVKIYLEFAMSIFFLLSFFVIFYGTSEYSVKCWPNRNLQTYFFIFYEQVVILFFFSYMFYNNQIFNSSESSNMFVFRCQYLIEICSI